MATRFEILLVGADPEHLEAVGEAALDEVTRIERLLSRHDRASEVSRINRDAAKRPVKVDRELFAILWECQNWSIRTEGSFDLCASSLPGSSRFVDAVELDPERRTIRFLDPTARLDFGSVGKGIAIDSASRILDDHGVRSAFVHGGTSSILVKGRQADGSPWRVGLRDPFDPQAKTEVIQLELVDGSLSTSAVFDPGSTRSDIIDPADSRPLTSEASCSVIAASAFEAEVLSTAFLVMGKVQARTFLDSLPGVRGVWIDRLNLEKLGSWEAT
jgi:thiamine biosynthesis lipoprotein